MKMKAQKDANEVKPNKPKMNAMSRKILEARDK
jgi:hypothetical protein